jgi:N utilization substance protein A
LIFDVLYDTRGPQIVLSRTHPELLINLFKTEVPEISEGIVEVKGAAREPGSRAKFAVSSHDSDIDPVGACVGMKGSRVQNVVQELRGEKIDIITWHVDAAKYVCNALAPAEISRVIIDEENNAMEVIVPDEFLSVAIGKRGQNVRLASKLTGWHLDVNSESKYDEMMKIGYESLVNVPGVGDSLADAFFEKGVYSAEELAESTVEELVEIRGIGQEKAVALIENARAYAIEAAEIAEARRLEDAARAAEEAAAAKAAAEEEALAGKAEEDAVPVEAPADASSEGAAADAESSEKVQ